MTKLVVIDLDGTLLNAEHQLGSLTKQTLHAVHAAGYELMIATGRHFQDVHRLAQQLEVPLSLITSNGARVHDCHGNLLYENHIPAHLVAEVLDLSQSYGVHRNIYQGDNWWVEEENQALLEIHQASGFGYQITDFAELNPQHIDKFYFNAAHEKLEPLAQSLQQRVGGQLYITFTTEIYLEVMNKGVSKATALSQLCAEKGIDAKEVMAFGDGFNDLEMLLWAGHSVLMANANPLLQQRLPLAKRAISNAKEGVAHYLQAALLNG
ncbi:haloacid dehalogenase [Thiosulfatimonas sediminis]|uniref:Haloacid dehalogenase n=1 Tax=Thiosulfatimonas sediminis TaxID=2675054 RepID=A0A6F8PY89_9GAMM|nr:HAD family hydrolase [Thiosulfatimonas sediminis]BBP47089.1 haloacid dehalogenase [Thiosulfatimonas sediminis]